MTEQAEDPKAETFAYIFPTENDAQEVLAAMQGIINMFSFVSVADFKDLVGIPVTFDDNNVGWQTLDGVTVARTEDGFHILGLPKPETDVVDSGVADIVAGVEKAAAMEENRDQAVEKAQIGEDTFGAKLDRIESKLDELLARGT